LVHCLNKQGEDLALSIQHAAFSRQQADQTHEVVLPKHISSERSSGACYLFGEESGLANPKNLAISIHPLAEC
jgi:hypothetical protein